MKKLVNFLISVLLVSCQMNSPSPIPNTETNGGEEYKPHKTYVVDYDSINNNVLVRGNEPLDSDGFSAYDQINQRLKDTLGDKFDLSNYVFIDISLISSQGPEKNILFDEFLVYGYPLGDTLASLNLNPPYGWPPFMGWNTDSTKAPWNTYNLYGNKINVKGKMYPGFLIWWPISACPDSSQTCNDIVSVQYGFPNLIDYINELMTERQNTVIYFHCIHGHDRTSTVACAYQIKFQGKDFNMVTTTGAPQGGLPVKDGQPNPLVSEYFDMLYIWNRDYKNK